VSYLTICRRRINGPRDVGRDCCVTGFGGAFTWMSLRVEVVAEAGARRDVISCA